LAADSAQKDWVPGWWFRSKRLGNWLLVPLKKTGCLAGGSAQKDWLILLKKVIQFR
jgi:hypothetical protein